MPEEKTDAILDFITISGTNGQILTALREMDIPNELFRTGVEELAKVTDGMRLFGMPEDSFRIDLTIARGLDYYTGTVYETQIDAHPEFGSVCSGGRYDNLTGYYTDKHLPGIGISIGLTRLFSQLLACGLIAPASYSGARVLVIPMDSTVLPFAAAAATELRGAGIATDVYYGDGGMKKKMKYAGKCGVPYVAIIGEAEAAEKTVALRDMRQSEQHSVSVTQAIEILKNSEI